MVFSALARLAEIRATFLRDILPRQLTGELEVRPPSAPTTGASRRITNLAATRLLADIRMRTAAPVKFVVNTHYHPDHVAGNAVFANAGATVVAQRNVRGWIHTENLKFLGPNPKPEQKALIDTLRPPVVSYEQTLDLYIGSREVRIRAFPDIRAGIRLSWFLMHASRSAATSFGKIPRQT